MTAEQILRHYQVPLNYKGERITFYPMTTEEKQTIIENLKAEVEQAKNDLDQAKARYTHLKKANANIIKSMEASIGEQKVHLR